MVTTTSLLAKVKNELRISTDADDQRLTAMIVEALAMLQLFKAKTLVDAVTDPTTETPLTPLDERFVFIYAAIHYDGAALKPALDNLLTLIRTK